jgi:MtN3 and saliva related transmembrane protein
MRSRRQPAGRFALSPPFIDMIGLLGVALTAVCSIPQAVKVLREHETRAISLVSTLGLTAGGLFWLVYGILRLDWALIASSSISLPMALLVLGLKLRYG